MTTIQKSVEIPEDRRLRLDLELPLDLPVGQAEIQLTITPLGNTRLESSPRPFEGLFGSLKESGIFADGGVAIQRKMRDEW